jgi:hypothetical protein
MKQMLFYEQPVMLSKDIHRNLKLDSTLNGYQFAAETQAVPLLALELLEIAKLYPIVFVQENNVFIPIALMSVEQNKNMFVKADGTWDGRYIPAFVRRYPFGMTEVEANERNNDSDTHLICIDEASPRLNTTTGQALFTEAGEPSATLQEVIHFMQQFQADTENTQAFCATLQRLALLKPIKMDVQLPPLGQIDGLSSNTNVPNARNFSIEGIFAIDEDKLIALPADECQTLLKNGYMARIIAHLMSLSNFSVLIDFHLKRESETMTVALS